MYVIKRDGRQEAVHFDKITARLKKLSYGLNTEHCDPVLVAQKVCAGVYKGVTTSQLDELAAETAAAMTANHPDYAQLAARIAVSNLHKNTKKSFSETVKEMYTHVNARSGLKAPLIADDVYNIIMENAARLDSEIIYDRDFDYDYFGFKTLERSYLLRNNGTVVERPQHMLMRVSVGIHKNDIDSVIKTYHFMSQRWFTHASPTLFNAGTPRPQLSSCFLVCMKDDSIEGIYDTLKECAVISKSAGGLGVSVHNIRATGSYIRGTNGTSNGIVPMLRVFNDTARYVDQGGGKRKGAFAMYLEPWHADIFEFLDLRKNHGKEENRARDLFFALWVPDLFMQRVQDNSTWSLFFPNEAPRLADCWGEKFEMLYKKYEQEGKAKKVVQAQKLWFSILESQIETGTPYMLFKDTCNGKSNQQNLGTIKSSNLCTEIIEYTSPTEMVVCNLASIALPRYVREKAVVLAKYKPTNWPSKGKVELKDLKVRYRTNSPLVLKGISCTFEAGHKIGIVGRMGSGKSTLIRLLQEPVHTIPDIIAVIIQAKVSLDRIEGFLRAVELQENAVVHNQLKNLEFSLVIKSGTLSWEANTSKPTLRNINFYRELFIDIVVLLLILLCGHNGEQPRYTWSFLYISFI